MFQNLLKVLVLSLILQTTVLSQQRIQYNLKVNDTFIFHQRADQNIVQDMDGAKHHIDNTIEDVIVLTVKKTTDSSYIMNLRFESFTMYINSDQYGVLANINTDSLNVEDPQSRIFMALTKSTMSFELLKTGKVRNFTGADEMIKKMIDNAGFDDEFTKAVMTESMKKEFGSKKMINSIEQFTYFYPTKSVSKGDTWKTNHSGDYTAENTWELTGLDKEKLSIKGSSSPVLKSQNESTIMKLSGTSKSEISVDRITGMILKMKVESTMEGKTVIKSAGSIEIPTTIISKTTYKALKNVQQNF